MGGKDSRLATLQRVVSLVPRDSHLPLSSVSSECRNSSVMFILHLVLKLGLPASPSPELTIYLQEGTETFFQKGWVLKVQGCRGEGRWWVLTSLSQTCLFSRYVGSPETPLLRNSPCWMLLWIPLQFSLQETGSCSLPAIATHYKLLHFHYHSLPLLPFKAQSFLIWLFFPLLI